MSESVQNKVEMAQSIFELANLMKADAGLIEKPLLKAGANVFAVFEDFGFKILFKISVRKRKRSFRKWLTTWREG